MHVSIRKLYTEPASSAEQKRVQPQNKASQGRKICDGDNNADLKQAVAYIVMHTRIQHTVELIYYICGHPFWIGEK